MRTPISTTESFITDLVRSLYVAADHAEKPWCDIALVLFQVERGVPKLCPAVNDADYDPDDAAVLFDLRNGDTDLMLLIESCAMDEERNIDSNALFVIARVLFKTTLAKLRDVAKTHPTQDVANAAASLWRELDGDSHQLSLKGFDDVAERALLARP